MVRAMTGLIVHETEGAWIERHDMPSGSTVFYKDGPDLSESQAHSYWQEWKGEMSCSKRLAGASTVAKNDGDTDTEGLCWWVQNLTCDGVSEVAGTELTEEWLANGRSISTRLRENDATWKDIRDAAGERGNVSHDVLQNLSEAVTPLLRSGFDHAVIDWWRKRRPDAQLVEQVAYSPEHGFAGRFDLLADFDGKRTLVDLKTSKRPYNSHAVQLNLYRIAMKESGLLLPERLMILYARADGQWLEMEVPFNDKWALDALTMYRHGSAIKKTTLEARKWCEANPDTAARKAPLAEAA